MKGSSRIIRVWKEIHLIIKEIADKEGFVMTDLASALLFEALSNPGIVFSALMKFFDIDFEDAFRISYTVQNEVDRIMESIVKEGEK